MARKQAETEYTRMCTRYGIWNHKFQDVRYCPYCQKPIFQTKRESNISEDESIVDYISFVGHEGIWTECKGAPGHTRLPFAETSEKQRSFMNDFTDRGTRCFLFVTLGNGRVPTGRKAWWILWEYYLNTERNAILYGQKSLNWILNNRSADRYTMQDLYLWELQWVEGGWSIPEIHPMYNYITPPIF